jgi:hypothetical protein
VAIGFAGSSTRALDSTRVVMIELVSVTECGSTGAAGRGAVDRTNLDGRARELAIALGCTNVIVSTRSSVDGLPLFSAAR